MGYSVIPKKKEEPMSRKKRDWSKCNKSLVNRGSITLWLSPEALKAWRAKKVKGKDGRPFKYSDTAIVTASTIKHVFRLSLRACQGFLQSLLSFLGTSIEAPSYTQVCRRSQKIQLPRHFKEGKRVKHVVLDGTGLKTYGEGEWKVKKHGAGSRRRWRKLHLAVDEETQEIVFADITTEHVHDTKFIPEILDRRKGLKRFLMDGAADSSKLYKDCWERNIDLLTRPPTNARKHSDPWMQSRNKRLAEIRGLGGDRVAKSFWAKLSGYSKRVTVESAIARWKKLFSQGLSSRASESQHFEVSIKSMIINKMCKVSR